MADTSPQGRLAVAKALRELAACGYYRVVKVRREDGTFVSETHVYDLPQVAPGPSCPGSGGPRSGGTGAHPVKEVGKEPALPARRRPSAAQADGEETDAADREEGGVLGAAVAMLFRVLRSEPRLRLGAAEALELAPLVAGWLEQGHGERALAAALLPGLPERVHAPAALLRARLIRKRPPAVAEVSTASGKPRWTECPRCGDPVAEAGICRSCAGLPPRRTAVGDAAVTARGMAKVQAALSQARAGAALAMV